MKRKMLIKKKGKMNIKINSKKMILKMIMMMEMKKKIINPIVKSKNNNSNKGCNREGINRRIMILMKVQVVDKPPQILEVLQKGLMRKNQ